MDTFTFALDLFMALLAIFFMLQAFREKNKGRVNDGTFYLVLSLILLSGSVYRW